MHTLLLEGPLESDYSLAVVNRRLAKALVQMKVPIQLHQRDNFTDYFPADQFLGQNADLACRILKHRPETPYDIHSRYIYPPHVDNYAGKLRVIHCYGWEETSFPRQYAQEFNRGVDLVTVMSGFVRDVLRASGVRVPIAVVGLGADHILEAVSTPVPGTDVSGFVFLHVSSCFPRKAVDVLVRSYCEEFTKDDNVRLIVKTFDNPHNTIREVMAGARSAWPNHPPIDIVWQSLSLGEMRWLYERSGCLVSASRGEGFGLPAAEAMMLGLPVVATIYSGQADICVEDGCWPVEYELTQAQSHLTEGESLWAEPAVASLRSQMRAVWAASREERARRAVVAAKHISSEFTWEQVAARHWLECCDAYDRLAHSAPRAMKTRDAKRPYRVGFVTSWNTPCGIAEYTRYLVQGLPSYCHPVIFASRSETVGQDDPIVVRCWEAGNTEDGDGLRSLKAAIVESGVEAISIQFNFGFFSPNRLHRLVEFLRQRGIATTVTMHATDHQSLVRLKPALSQADICICHRREAVETLRNLNTGAEVVLLRQGIPQLANGRESVNARRRRPSGSFVIASFGFFLPPKGIEQLIHSFAFAKNLCPLFRLRLINAIHPHPESLDYARRCLALVREKRLGDSVTFQTAFLDDTEVLAELASADLVVLPYLSSSESSSAAIRLPLASMTPILCSDLPIFDEFSDCVHRYPAGDGFSLANAIVRLSRHPEELYRFAARQRQVAKSLDWTVVAREFAELVATRIDGARQSGAKLHARAQALPSAS